MEKPKIAITPVASKPQEGDLMRQVYADTALLELFTPVFFESEEVALQALTQGAVAATVLVPAAEPVAAPTGSTEIIVTEKGCIMPLAKEPDAEAVVRLRDILERDFDLRSPRIAIVQDTTVQNPELATQVTDEHGINTYGPYTSEQILAEGMATHFDGIIVAGDADLSRRIASELSPETCVRFFAGREAVVTAVCRMPVEDATEDVSLLTHPIYTAIDILRRRAFYDEARRNVLPKLFRDKRDERRREQAAAQAADKADKQDKPENTEKPS